MKKILLILAAVMLVISVPVFAGGSQEEGGNIQLTIAGRDGAYGDAMQLAADEYTKLHPEVTFEILKLSGSSLFEKSVIDMKAGAGTYDLVLIDDPNATLIQKAGWLAELGPMYDERGLTPDPDFIAPLAKLGKFPFADDGTLYCLPHVGNVELFAYRKDLIEKHGLAEPATWDDVMAAAKTLAANEPDVTPVLFRGSKGNPIVTGFLPLFWSFGANVLVDGKSGMDSPEALTALEFFLELAKYAPEGVSMYQSAQVKDAVYSGSGAMAIEVWPGWIKNLDNPEESAVVGKVTVTKHPAQVKKSSPMIGVWLAGIPESSMYKEAAFDFLLFLTSEEMQTKMADATGIPPTRESVHKVQSLVEKYAWYPAQLDGLQNGVPRPRTNKWKEIEEALGTYLQLALIGEMDAESALAEVHKKINDIVD